ncbi:hypothetical protein BHM03_00054348 [Ensete ventricosum]|nr:hypothetical protein BHM03_00054348 [Ensete ventricosum]
MTNHLCGRHCCPWVATTSHGWPTTSQVAIAFARGSALCGFLARKRPPICSQAAPPVCATPAGALDRKQPIYWAAPASDCPYRGLDRGRPSLLATCLQVATPFTCGCYVRCKIA